MPKDPRSQISQIRRIAESLAKDIQDDAYFNRICTDILDIFDAAACGLFWFRRRKPASWWLDAHALKDKRRSPVREMIPEEEEGALGKMRQRPLPILSAVKSDEAVLRIWGIDGKNSTVGLFPSNMGDRFGALVVVDPQLAGPEDNLQSQLDTLGGLVATGIRNRLLYKGLHDSEEEFRDLIHNSSDMVLVVYPDGMIRECNAQFVKTLKLDLDPQGRKLAELIVEEQGDALEECWKKLLKGEEVHSIDIFLKRADGKIVEAELSGNARMKAGGSVGVIRLYIRDLTDRREAERRHKKTEIELELARTRQLAEVGLFASGIAHNLANPVQTLLTYLEYLEPREKDIPELAVIQKSTNRIMDIIQNLLRKMRRQRVNEPVDVDVNEVLRDELNFLEANSYYKHEVTKRFHFGEDIPYIRAVAGDLSQAMMNVVYNALEAMRDSPERSLTIITSLDKRRGEILVSIADTGPGIPKEIGDKIFHPLFTTKKQDAEQHDPMRGGTGLGLSSAVTLISNYGGKISYQSEVGKGTTFFLKIPVHSKS